MPSSSVVYTRQYQRGGLDKTTQATKKKAKEDGGAGKGKKGKGKKGRGGRK